MELPGLKQIFTEVMKEYEKDRDRALAEQRRKMEELYRELPKIGDMDKEIAATGAELARCVLNRDKERISELSERNEVLAAERLRLLEEWGYDPTYFQINYKCPVCRDTGFLERERCSCLKQKLINRYYEISNLSRVLENATFDSFDLNYYSDTEDAALGMSPRANMIRNYNLCLDFVQNFDKTNYNLLLYGDTGLGKTFLCNCIARELLDRGKTVLYITAAQLFKMVENDRFHRKEEESDSLEMVFTADLLIVDDLGSEFATAVTDSELFNIINSRLLSESHTIVSTNLSHNDIRESYSDRITSRLMGRYHLLKFFGDDVRLLKKYSGM